VRAPEAVANEPRNLRIGAAFVNPNAGLSGAHSPSRCTITA